MNLDGNAQLTFALCALFPNLLRRALRTKWAWIHTAAAQWVMTALAAMAAAVQHVVVSSGHVSSVIALHAALGALFALIAADNPSGTTVVSGDAAAAPPAPPLSSLRALLPLLFLPAVLSACAFGTCLLNHLKANAQTLIVDATEALTGASWETDLALLVGEAGPDVVNCTVQAIVLHEQAKRDALAKLEQSPIQLDGGVGALPPPAALALAISPVLLHGTLWLAKHPATACKDAKPKNGHGDYGRTLAAARWGGVS